MQQPAGWWAVKVRLKPTKTKTSLVVMKIEIATINKDHIQKLHHHYR